VGSVVVWLAVALALGPLELVVLPEDRRFLGLALADSAKHAAHAVVMLVLVRKALGSPALKGLLRTLLAAGAAAALMGLLVAGLDRGLALWLTPGTGAFLVRAVAGAGLGAAVYLPLASRLGVEEVGWIFGMLRQRLGR
jgi:hypothetical protein